MSRLAREFVGTTDVQGKSRAPVSALAWLFTSAPTVIVISGPDGEVVGAIVYEPLPFWARLRWVVRRWF